MVVRNMRGAPVRGFTIVEVLVAATISLFVLAGVLAANLNMLRSSIRLSNYVEMDSQIRRALEHFSADLKAATAITWNGSSDLTLTIPTTGTDTRQVTYAWTAASGSFFRVAGASSATLTGRLDLIQGIPALADGSPGLSFARFDRDGNAVTTDAETKSIQVSATVSRSVRAGGAGSRHEFSATFTLRNKKLS